MTVSTTLFRTSARRARYLVVVNKGPGAIELPRDGDNWDLLEIYFKPDDIQRVTSDPSCTDAEYVVFETDRNRRKFAIMKAIFEAGDWWRDYDAILLADDDVEPVGCTIHQIFALFMETGCRIGQPALTQDSYFAHFLTVQNDNFRWRRVNHIDFMCIMMTPAAIADYLHVMDETVSSFGCDVYWGLGEWQRGTAHAVLDETPMRHCRPVGGGESIKTLTDAQGEYQRFLSRHGLRPYPKLCLDGVPASQASRWADHMGRCLTGYSQSLLDGEDFQIYGATEIAALPARTRSGRCSPDELEAAPEIAPAHIGLPAFSFDAADVLHFEPDEWRSIEYRPGGLDLEANPLKIVLLIEGESPALRIAAGSGRNDPWSDCGDRYLNAVPGLNSYIVSARNFRMAAGHPDYRAIEQISIGGFGGPGSAKVHVWCVLPDGSSLSIG